MIQNKLTLHEAIEIVLKGNDNEPMTYDEIAHNVNEQKLFVRPSDGMPVQGEQIRLRTYVQKRYKHLFIVDNNMVKLADR